MMEMDPALEANVITVSDDRLPRTTEATALLACPGMKGDYFEHSYGCVPFLENFPRELVIHPDEHDSYLF